MRRLILILTMLGAAAAAQNYTAITGSNVTDAGGNKLASGTISLLGVDNTNTPVSFAVGGGGQVLRRPFTCAITAGVIAGGCQVPNPANTSPAGILYRVVVKDTTTGSATNGQVVIEYPQPGTTQSPVAFTGSTWDLDNYQPGGISVPPPPTPASVTGPLDVTGNITATGEVAAGSVSAAIASLNNIVNVQAEPGADFGAKLEAALSSSACSAGCELTDGDAVGASETVSASDLPITVTAPIVFHQHARINYTGAANAAGLLYFTTAAQGFSWSCSNFEAPQNFNFGYPTGACGFDIEPSSGSMPGIVIGYSASATLNTASFVNEVVIVNGHVTDPILGAASGGMSNITLRWLYVAPSSASQNWSDFAIALKCWSSSATTNGWNNDFLDHIFIVGDGVGAQGTGAESGGGISFDPGTGGAGCGTAENTIISNSAIYGINGARSINLGSQGALKLEGCQFGLATSVAADYTVAIRAGADGAVVADNHWEENNQGNAASVSDLGILSSHGVLLAGNGFTGSTLSASRNPQQAVYIDGSSTSVDLTGQFVQGYRNCGINIASGAEGILVKETYEAGSYGSSSEFCSGLPDSNGALTLASNGDVAILLASLAGGSPWELVSSGTGGLNPGHFMVYNAALSQRVLDIDPSTNDMTQVNGTASLNATTVSSLTIGSGGTVNATINASATVAFSAIAAGACQTQTMTVMGATAGKAAFFSPASSVGSFSVMPTLVSATNTVTVGLCNPSGSPATPTAVVWSGWVIQ